MDHTASLDLPGSFVAVRRHNDALITKEVTEGMSVALTSSSVEVENNWDLLAGRCGRNCNLSGPDIAMSQNNSSQYSVRNKNNIHLPQL